MMHKFYYPALADRGGYSDSFPNPREVIQFLTVPDRRQNTTVAKPRHDLTDENQQLNDHHRLVGSLGVLSSFPREDGDG